MNNAMSRTKLHKSEGLIIATIANQEERGHRKVIEVLAIIMG